MSNMKAIAIELNTPWRWFEDSQGGAFYRLLFGCLQAKESIEMDPVDVDLYLGCSDVELTADCARIFDDLLQSCIGE